jgi:hypothetical protein
MRARQKGTGLPPITRTRLSPSVISGRNFCTITALGAVAIERLRDAAQIQAVWANPEDAHAAHAIERFEDDVLVFGMEALDVLPRRA